MDDSRTVQKGVILLGASNVARGISIVVESARCIIGGPVQVSAAIGHGRSYGLNSSFLGRSLPGILQSRLWEAVPRHKVKQWYALITDIGNDILYGVEPEEIAAWIDQCCERLNRFGARTVMTALPMERLFQLRSWQYIAVRTALFPKCRIEFGDAIERAKELDRRVREIAASRSLPLVEPDPAWYGLDPIHIRMRVWPQAWGRILGDWPSHEVHRAAAKARGSLVRWFRLRTLRAAQWKWLGVAMGSRHPRRFADGSTVMFF